MPFRLGQLSLSVRWLATLALLVLSAGYGVAVLNLYYTYSMMDGQPGLTPEDMKRAFHGRRTVTRLAAKIDGGSMEQYLPNPREKAAILNWLQDGAHSETFAVEVRSVLIGNCWRCHNSEGLMSMRPLQTYEQVMEVAQVDRGEPVPVWARVAHTHLQSIGLILFVAGMIFTGTGWPERVKVALVITPFAGLLVDFGSRFLARYSLNFVYLMMSAGAITGISFAAMVLTSLYEMWTPGKGGSQEKCVVPSARVSRE